MLCRSCQATELQEPLEIEGSGDDAGELCSRCGHLRAPEDMVKRVRAKDTQLERFGLAGRRGALLDRRRRQNKDKKNKNKIKDKDKDS